MNVLVVDDSALLRERLISLISEIPGVSTINQAQDVPQALHSIKTLKPDVVILDIRLSEGNGIEVLRTIRKKNRAPITIMFTNHPYPQYRKKCQEAGADYFFDKSTEFHMIPDTLIKLIEDSHSESIHNLKRGRLKKKKRRQHPPLILSGRRMNSLIRGKGHE